MKRPQTLTALRVALAVAVLCMACPVHAGDHEPEWEDDDHVYDRARRAVDSGEALPIAELLERLREQLPGEVVGIEFEREHGRWLYEFRVVADDGRLLEVTVDAQSGEILSLEDD